MEQQSLTARLAALLGETGSAHGLYEETQLGGARDAQWPQWYAAYLQNHGFYELLAEGGVAPGGQPLDAWLIAADKQHQANAPQEPWTEYYAQYFLVGAPPAA